MFSRISIGLLILVGVIALSGDTRAWAWTKATGGSLYTCKSPGLDLNGDGIIDVTCSVIGQISWIGGFPGTAIAQGSIQVKEAIAICDNNGTAFKVTLPGKGGIAEIASTATVVFFDSSDDKGHFDTIFHFPNRVDDKDVNGELIFANVDEFLAYWFTDAKNPCKKTWTLVELRLKTVVLTGEVGKQCTDSSDISTCRDTTKASFSCSTIDPLADLPIYTCSGPN